jgi:hypothetical protein
MMTSHEMPNGENPITERRITGYLHAFGPLIKREDVEKILDPKFSGLEGTLYEANKDLLERFFDLPIGAISTEIMDRYLEVSDGHYLPIAPYTPQIGDRLLNPLRSAKRNYCLGDYSAAIAIAGMVGEMLAILVWKIYDVQFKGRTITEQEEEGMFGKTFEELGQDRRLGIIRACGFTSDDQHRLFMEIKNGRNRYLHSWTVDPSDPRCVALDAVRKAFRLFQEITAVGLGDKGTVKMNPLFLKLFNVSGDPA